MKTGVKRPLNNCLYIASGITRKAVYVPFDPVYFEMSEKPINERKIDFFFLGTIDNYKPYRKEVFLKFPSIENRTTLLLDVGNALKLDKCDFDDFQIDQTQNFLRCKIPKTKKFFEWLQNSKFSLMMKGHDFQR
jgi:hypothetical protein